MKRDDMLIYLEQCLIELRGYQDDNCEIVETLLYAAEDVGMLPPPQNKEMHERCSTRFNYEWEPENE